MKTDSPSITRLLLVRHAATDANQQQPHILQGRRIDQPLSASGLVQAHALADFLQTQNIAYVYSSGLKRAMQTARAVADRHEIGVEIIEALHEIDAGNWHGKTWQQVAADDGAAYRDYQRFPDSAGFPGGENYSDVLVRAKPVISDLLHRHRGETLVVVSHNVVNRVLCADLLGLDLNKARTLQQQNTGVNLIHGLNGEMVLVTMNACFHLETPVTTVSA